MVDIIRLANVGLIDLMDITQVTRLQRSEHIVSDNAVNTKHFYNICTMSAKRLRRWPSIVQILETCFVLTRKLCS